MIEKTEKYHTKTDTEDEIKMAGVIHRGKQFYMMQFYLVFIWSLIYPSVIKESNITEISRLRVRQGFGDDYLWWSTRNRYKRENTAQSIGHF